MPPTRIASLLVGIALGVAVFAGCGDSKEEEATSSPTNAATATPSPVPTPEPPPLSENHRIIIDKIGVDAPTDTYGLDESAIPIVPTGSDAAEVVAWYDFSARPGMPGNAVYAGHVTWNGDAVFKQLNTLVAGDIIKLRDDRGAEVVYSVTQTFSVDPNDPKSVEVIRALDDDVITLVTCGGSYFTTDDPVLGGDYTERVIIRGDLVSVTRAP